MKPLRGLKPRQKSILVLALIVGGSFAAAAGFGVLTGKPFTAAQLSIASIPADCTGVTALSVSKPPFIGTNVQSLAGLNWILQFASGGSQCFQWGSSASDLQQGTTLQVQNGVTFAATNYKEHILYDIAPDGGEIFTFDHWPADYGKSGSFSLLGGASYYYDTTGDGWIWVPSGYALPPCPASPAGRSASAEVILRRGGFGVGFGGAGESFKLWCIAYVQAGATARLVGPGKRHEANFQVGNGRETLTQQLGVEDKDVGAEFRFPGATQNAATLKMVTIAGTPSALDPNTAGLVGYYDFYQAKWRTVTSGNMNTNYLATRFTPAKTRTDDHNILTKGSSVSDATDQLITQMDDANSYLYTIPDQKVVTAPGFTETFSGGQSGGRLSYVGPRTFYTTTYQLIVAAEWVGVFLPSGKPAIQYLTPLELGTAQTGTITATVKNDANVQASFNFDATCSPATVTAINPPRLVPFGAYQTQQQQITISKGTTTGVVDSSCTIRVCDSESPSTCDSKVTRVSSQATGACVPGTQLPLPAEIQECGQDGRYYTKATCPLGVVPGAGAGVYQCAVSGPGTTATPFFSPPPPPPGGGGPRFVGCDTMCKLGKLPTIVWAIGGIIIAGIGFAVYRKRKRGY